jgi:hypothetical protein
MTALGVPEITQVELLMERLLDNDGEAVQEVIEAPLVNSVEGVTDMAEPIAPCRPVELA